MWHEARKQERKIRGMLVDYRKRAERRRDFYEKIKADPTQFLQVHGRQSKISLDPCIAAAADSVTTMMPWQGHQDNLIDRFDVRAHLDFIPPVPKLDDEEPTLEDRQLNYERYRIIAQNSFLQIGEEKFLKQLHLEEQFGYTEQQEPKKKKTGGVAIGFNYEDGTGTSQPAPVIHQEGGQSDSDNSDGSDSDLDVDLSINVSKVDSAEAHEMNRHGRNFGMSTNDFYSFLTNDLEEAENFRLAKEEENEKALFAGRKSRRERRAHREKRLANRKISPPSYAAQVSPTTLANAIVRSKSPSHSPSPEVNEKITYITSFGGDDEPQMPLNPTYADKVKFGNKMKKLRRNNSSSEERLVFCEKKPSRSSDRYGIRRKSPSPRQRSRSYDRAGSRRSHQRNHHKSRSSSTSSSSRSRSRSRRSRSRSMRRRNRQRSSSKSLSKSRSRSASDSDDSLSSSRRSKRSGSRGSSVVRAGSGGKGANVDVIKMELGGVMKDAQMKQEKTISPPKAIPRYYGRRRSDRSSSSELGVSSDENGATKMDLDENPVSSPATQRNLSSGNASTSAKVSSSGSVLSLQERLKRKRQALLNKQFKADKIAEQLKTEREKQEQQTREDELREMAIKLRRKQRERRHAYDSDNSSSASSTSSKSQNNSNPTSHTDLSLNRNKSRSKSPSSHSSNHKRSRESSKSKSTSTTNLRNRDRDRDLRSKSPRDSRDNIGRSGDRERASRGAGSKDSDRRSSADRDRNGRRSSGDRDRESRNSRLDRTDRDRDRGRDRRSRSMSRSRRDGGGGSGRRGRDDSRGRRDDSRSRRDDSRGGRHDRDRDGRDWNRSSTRLVDY